MVAFIAHIWVGEFDDDYFAQPAPDPAAHGMPVEDDGSRDDPLLSARSLAVTGYRPDVAAINAARTHVVVPAGEESRIVVTGRTAITTAALLGQASTVFPSHHEWSMATEFGCAGQPEASAERMRHILDND